MIRKRFTKKPGDVSLFVVLMMVSIMSIIMTSVSNRSIAEINLSRQTFLGLQALQAANAGIELWLARFKDSSGSLSDPICAGDPSPECQSPISDFFPSGDVELSYRVEPVLSGSVVQSVIGVGTAEISEGGNVRYSITRSLEVEF